MERLDFEKPIVELEEQLCKAIQLGKDTDADVTKTVNDIEGKLDKLRKDIEQQGLDDELKSAVSKTQQLKDKFSSMLTVLGISVYRGGDILAYTFLLPILGMIINVANTFGFDSVEMATLTTSLVHSGLITVSSVVFRDVMQKIASKLSSRHR